MSGSEDLKHFLPFYPEQIKGERIFCKWQRRLEFSTGKSVKGQVLWRNWDLTIRVQGIVREVSFL